MEGGTDAASGGVDTPLGTSCAAMAATAAVKGSADVAAAGDYVALAAPAPAEAAEADAGGAAAGSADANRSPPSAN